MNKRARILLEMAIRYRDMSISEWQAQPLRWGPNGEDLLPARAKREIMRDCAIRARNIMAYATES